MSFTEQTNQVIAELETLKKEYQEKGSTAMSKVFKVLLDEFPEVHCITWHQYTPYFNDGEPCVFSVNEIYLMPLVEEGTEITHKYGTSSFESYNDFDSLETFSLNKWNENASDELIAADFALCKFMKMNETVLLDLYGDHTQVLVYRDRIETEEYEHE